MAWRRGWFITDTSRSEGCHDRACGSAVDGDGAGRSIVLDLVSCKAHKQTNIELYGRAVPAIGTGQEFWTWHEVHQQSSVYTHRTPLC